MKTKELGQDMCQLYAQKKKMAIISTVLVDATWGKGWVWLARAWGGGSMGIDLLFAQPIFDNDAGSDSLYVIRAVRRLRPPGYVRPKTAPATVHGSSAASVTEPSMWTVSARWAFAAASN